MRGSGQKLCLFFSSNCERLVSISSLWAFQEPCPRYYHNFLVGKQDLFLKILLPYKCFLMFCHMRWVFCHVTRRDGIFQIVRGPWRMKLHNLGEAHVHCAARFWGVPVWSGPEQLDFLACYPPGCYIFGLKQPCQVGLIVKAYRWRTGRVMSSICYVPVVL